VRPARSSGYVTWASSPKVGAGCGNSARPDLWRGCSAMGIPTPTRPSRAAGRGKEPRPLRFTRSAAAVAALSRHPWWKLTTLAGRLAAPVRKRGTVFLGRAPRNASAGFPPPNRKRAMPGSATSDPTHPCGHKIPSAHCAPRAPPLIKPPIRGGLHSSNEGSAPTPITPRRAAGPQPRPRCPSRGENRKLDRECPG